MKPNAAMRRELVRLRSLHGAAGNAFGGVYERFAAELFKLAAEAGLVRSFWKTKRRGFQDRRGVDIFFVDRNGRTHRLQVKASRWMAVRFRREHPDIPVLVVTLRNPHGTVRRLEKLFPILRGLRRHYQRRGDGAGAVANAC